LQGSSTKSCFCSNDLNFPLAWKTQIGYGKKIINQDNYNGNNYKIIIEKKTRMNNPKLKKKLIKKEMESFLRVLSNAWEWLG
jgi:hypothetical protein